MYGAVPPPFAIVSRFVAPTPMTYVLMSAETAFAAAATLSAVDEQSFGSPSVTRTIGYSQPRAPRQ